MISPKKTKLWETAIGIVTSVRDLRGQISCWRCSWNWGSHSSSCLLLAMTLYLLTFLLLKNRKEGWFLVTKIGSEWTDTWRIARVYKASPSLGCWQMFLVLTEYSWICFHLKSCIEGDGSHQREVIFRIFLVWFGFLKVEYLKRIF